MIIIKCVILAGGFGTRISEESHLRPKPMIEIGGMPILWHIMKIYSAYGVNDFIICCGYKQQVIKEFFADYYLHRSNVTFDFTQANYVAMHKYDAEPWRVTVIDTGLNTMTGGRVKRIREYTGGEPFYLTYGDGVADVDIPALMEFHRAHGKIATITAVGVSQKFGVIDIDRQNRVSAFREKDSLDKTVVNGGFMVMNPQIFDYLDGDETVLEKEPLMRLAKKGELMAYRHEGFWKCMDTQRDKQELEAMWEKGNPPWRNW